MLFQTNNITSYTHGMIRTDASKVTSIIFYIFMYSNTRTSVHFTVFFIADGDSEAAQQTAPPYFGYVINIEASTNLPILKMIRCYFVHDIIIIH
jgi:hypothetical protein